MTRPTSQREAALYLVELGLNDCQIGRILEMPRGTIGWWRRGNIPRGWQTSDDCPRCHGAELDEESYAYLLGLYLGDGCLTEMPRDVFKLRIVCCDAYPGLMKECEKAMLAMRPPDAMKIGRVHAIGCTEVNSYWKHWACLFPQHGPGRKHERPIVLEAWQQEIVDRYPQMLLRGLIHSDGWRGRNQGRGQNGKLYYYSRYQFSNNSDDIRKIFRDACEAQGIDCKRSNWNTISVSRRAAVAKLDEFVGPKY